MLIAGTLSKLPAELFAAGESLCPDCKDFTSRVLHKLYLSDIFPFINFR